jgi:hypothetical protein
MMKIALIYLLCIASIGVGQTAMQDQQTIDDGDKTSSKINDLITDVETAQKAIDAASTAKEAVDMAKNLKKLNLKEKAKDAIVNKLIVYKYSKQSFIKFVSDITGKVSDVLDRASGRINMWRTTEPTLLAFGDGLKNMADNTVKVFQEFEAKDLIDIDRKWDRKMEDQLSANKRYVMGTIAFLSYEMSKKSREAFVNMFLEDGMRQELTKTPLAIRATAVQLQKPVHAYRQIPTAVLQRASESIAACGEINAQAHSPSSIDPTMSQEQQDFVKIQTALQDRSQTYEDAREMFAFIALKRQTITTQTAQLEQMYSFLQADLARMVLHDQETVALQSEQVSNSLKTISKGAPMTTIEQEAGRE